MYRQRQSVEILGFKVPADYDSDEAGEYIKDEQGFNRGVLLHYLTNNPKAGFSVLGYLLEASGEKTKERAYESGNPERVMMEFYGLSAATFYNDLIGSVEELRKIITEAPFEDLRPKWYEAPQSKEDAYSG